MVNQFVITKRLNGTEECVQYFQKNTRKVKNPLS